MARLTRFRTLPRLMKGAMFMAVTDGTTVRDRTSANYAAVQSIDQSHANSEMPRVITASKKVTFAPCVKLDCRKCPLKEDRVVKGPARLTVAKAILLMKFRMANIRGAIAHLKQKKLVFMVCTELELNT